MNYPDDDEDVQSCMRYDHCAGLFVDGHTLAVTRCDYCERFETDFDAAACAHALIDLLRRVGRQLHRQGKKCSVADAMDELVKRAHVEDEPEQLQPAADFGPIDFTVRGPLDFTARYPNARKP